MAISENNSRIDVAKIPSQCLYKNKGYISENFTINKSKSLKGSQLNIFDMILNLDGLAVNNI